MSDCDWLIEQLINDENYRICSSGQIFSNYTRQGHKSSEWRELVQFDKQRYKFISYRRKKIAVHRIVARNFLGKIPKKHQVNHIDGNPGNNNLQNLEIVSQAKNNLHRFRVLLHPPVIGNSKINFEVADAIREDAFVNGLSYSKLRQKYGLGKGHVSAIINNKIWK